jgi:hypothetical protein
MGLGCEGDGQMYAYWPFGVQNLAVSADLVLLCLNIRARWSNAWPFDGRI